VKKLRSGNPLDTIKNLNNNYFLKYDKLKVYSTQPFGPNENLKFNFDYFEFITYFNNIYQFNHNWVENIDPERISEPIVPMVPFYPITPMIKYDKFIYNVIIFVKPQLDISTTIYKDNKNNNNIIIINDKKTLRKLRKKIK
jgi:hypothetical protein